MYSEEYVEQKDIVIEDAWKSDTQARTLMDRIEAVWSSASELVEGSLVKPIEVIWSSASDVDNKLVEDIWESEHSDDKVNHSPAPLVVNDSPALPVMRFVRSMHEQTKKQLTMQQRGFICMGPNHKVKLGGNASNQNRNGTMLG